jgi:hypothetical protein
MQATFQKRSFRCKEMTRHQAPVRKQIRMLEFGTLATRQPVDGPPGRRQARVWVIRAFGDCDLFGGWCLRWGAWFLAAATIFAASLPGCARSAADRFTPVEDAATACVEATLAAWRDGQPADALADRRPAIHVVDTIRQPGQKLAAFEVLSKSRASAAGWTYVVRLTYDEASRKSGDFRYKSGDVRNSGEERARFVVVGVDPIWVFRKEDYDKLAHWEHPMEQVGEESNEAPAANRPVSAAPPSKPGDDT